MRTPRPAGGCHQCCTSPSAELLRRAAQQVLAHEPRLRMHERHRVLQLVAEAEGAAGLVVAAARPEAAGQRLVQEPAVGQHVQRRVGRLDLHRAERAAPVLAARCRAQRAPSRTCAAACASARACSTSASRAEPEDDLPLLRRRPVRTAPGSRRRDRAPRRACRKAAIASSRRDSRACRSGRGTRCGRRSACATGRRRRRRRRGRRTRCCRRCARTARRWLGSISVTTCMRGFRPQVAEHPLDVAGRRQAPRAAGSVAHLQHRELDRRPRGPRRPTAPNGCRRQCARTRCSRIRGGCGTASRRSPGSGVGDQKWPLSSSRR